jgi:prepilin-type N-terminal cleavage/methylation domain-containing protein
MPRVDNIAAHPHRSGLTLLEMLISIAVSTILVGTLSMMASAVQQASDFTGGQTDAIQHAQVVLDRLQRMVGEAYATETYPGVVVVDETVGSYRYPDTVVIWHPTGKPTNTAGPPLVQELVIVCPNPTKAGELIEITAPADTRTIQLNDASLNTTAGRALISGIKTASTSVKTSLTPLLRTAATSTASNTALRGAIRFECELHPTAAEMSAYRVGTTTWAALNFPQNVSSSAYGMRQVWLRTELQLLSEPYRNDGTVPDTATTLPFFGSAAFYYTLQN